MRPKYFVGVKVRIKSCSVRGTLLDPAISQYDNMVGEIIESTNIVAFIVEPWANLEGTGGRVTVYHYKVRINSEITLPDVMEECLEIA